MTVVQLKRSFLRNPFNSIGILLLIAFIIEGVGWAAAFNLKLANAERYGGVLNYLGTYVRVMIIPEVCTLYILIRSINIYHTVVSISDVRPDWRSILRYELRMLPILLGAFFIFNPFTQTVRYFLETYPSYSFSDYWDDFVVGTYTVRIYIMYLVPILLVGYIAVNISLFVDYLAYRRDQELQAEQAAAQLNEEVKQTMALQGIPAGEETLAKEYTTVIKGRTNQGEMLFSVHECCYFIIEGKYYYLAHQKGKYIISKTLNELETELDPAQFFRANRGVILNRRTVQGYAYWEKGKYIIHLDQPGDQTEITLPRARLQEFKDWLAGNPGSNTSDQSPSLPDTLSVSTTVVLLGITSIITGGF